MPAPAKLELNKSPCKCRWSHERLPPGLIAGSGHGFRAHSHFVQLPGPGMQRARPRRSWRVRVLTCAHALKLHYLMHEATEFAACT